MKQSKTVKTAGEAISVLIQVANLAQSKGVLSFDDSIVTKSAIDFLEELASNQNVENPVMETNEHHMEVSHEVSSKRKGK